MRNAPAIVNGVLMLGLLVAGGAMSAYVFWTPELRGMVTRPYPGDDYINGHVSASIEGTYKDQLPIRDRSVDLLNAFTLAVFDEGRKGVVVGEDGWLFSAEEYDWTPKSSRNLEANLRRIGIVAADLKARGIRLEIALVPEKADVYSDLLLKPRPEPHDGKYELVRARLVALTGEPVPDLRNALLEGSDHATVYFPTDTHWSVAGAGLAALTLARHFPLPGVSGEDIRLEPEPVVHHDGDLLRFLELGPFGFLLPRTDDRVIPLKAVVSSGSVDDFLGSGGAEAPQVALIGTSYSANLLWSFEPQLKAALGRDVLNLAEAGHGPMEPMDAFLQSVRAGTVKVEAVIWEIPIRYLDDDPKAAGRNST